MNSLTSCLLLSLAVLTPLQAKEIVIHRESIPQMCMIADVIVSGRHEGEGRIRLAEVMFADEVKGKGMKKGDILKVPSIADHTLLLADGAKPEQVGKAIETRQLLLFLTVSGYDGTIRSINDFDVASTGAIWFDDNNCYSYIQKARPSRFELVDSTKNRQMPAKGEAELMTLLQQSLVPRREWEDVLAIDEPQRRARAMTLLYMKAHRRENHIASPRMTEQMVQLGPEGVQPMAEAMAEQGGEEVSLMARALIQIATRDADDRKEWARRLKPAVPAMVDWLENQKGRHVTYVLDLLGFAADPRAANAVRPFLKSRQEEEFCRAARALGSMGDKESFDAIAALMRRHKGRAGNFLGMLPDALLELDAERAKPIIAELEKAKRR